MTDKVMHNMHNIQSRTFFDDYNTFADACSIPQGSLVEPPNISAIELAERLVVEEWETETKTALARYKENPSLENLVEVADGIGDSIYVLCQLARSLGVPLNLVWNAIQTANMAKCVEVEEIDPRPEGKWVTKYTVKRREDGKILKPDGWKPPDIWAVLFNESQRLCKEQGKFGGAHWFKEGA